MSEIINCLQKSLLVICYFPFFEFGFNVIVYLAVAVSGCCRVHNGDRE